MLILSILKPIYHCVTLNQSFEPCLSTNHDLALLMSYTPSRHVWRPSSHFGPRTSTTWQERSHLAPKVSHSRAKLGAVKH